LLKVFLLGSALSAFASVLGATVLVTGTPNLSGGSNGVATGLSPKFGTLISFDDLTPNSLLGTGAYLSFGVSSISAINSTAALSAVPFSGQTQPNYVGPADFSNIDNLISLTQSTDEMGIGLLAGSSNSFTLTARNAADAILNSRLDDLQFDPATAGGVPEPGYLALLGGGLMLGSALSKYRRKL
jgi:hypothetical protein